MTRDERDQLEKQREALKQEISTLNEAITDIDTPAFYGRSKQDQLQNLRTVRSTRERELQDVESQLAQGTEAPR